MRVLNRLPKYAVISLATLTALLLTSLLPMAAQS